MANNTFEAAYMKLKNGMTLFFKDGGARELIDKLQAAVSLIKSIPPGGTTDQVLKKHSNDDFDVEWGAGGGSGVVNTWYATCSTAAGTAAKVATSATGDFVLDTGNMVRILFSDTNIQTQPTLSVDGSTAKRIKNITTDNNITTNLWRAGEVVDLVYDGTQFVVSGGGLANGTYYGRTKLSNSTSSSSQTTAASSKAVKDTYDAIPAASSAPPQDLGTAAAGSSTDYSRADHVHNLPTIPSPSSATPQDLGTAAAGSSTDYSRADHVHNKPTYSKSDVGLGNVDNVQQYSASNPPPNDLPAGGSAGQALLKISGTDYDCSWGSVPSGTMYFPNQNVNVASNAEIFRITDAIITTQTVVAEITFADPAYITSDVTWTSYNGYIAFNGTCTTATTANVTLANVETPSPTVPLAVANGGTGANNAADAADNLGFNEGTGYIKLPNGTMICWGMIDATLTTSNWSTWSNSYWNIASPAWNNIAFAQTFYSVPSVTVTSYGSNWCICARAAASTTAFTEVSVCRPNAYAGQFIMQYVAVGRWKA